MSKKRSIKKVINRDEFFDLKLYNYIKENPKNNKIIDKDLYNTKFGLTNSEKKIINKNLDLKNTIKMIINLLRNLFNFELKNNVIYSTNDHNYDFIFVQYFLKDAAYIETFNKKSQNLIVVILVEKIKNKISVLFVNRDIFKKGFPTNQFIKYYILPEKLSSKEIIFFKKLIKDNSVSDFINLKKLDKYKLDFFINYINMTLSYEKENEYTNYKLNGYTNIFISISNLLF